MLAAIFVFALGAVPAWKGLSGLVDWLIGRGPGTSRKLVSLVIALVFGLSCLVAAGTLLLISFDGR